MITVESLSKSYDGVKIVDCVSLEIKSNTTYGIIGKSGAGKSTLIKLMGLLEKPDSGEIHFDSCRVDNLRGNDLLKCRYQFGMVFQNFNLFSSRNVFENIAYPMEIIGKDSAYIKNRTNELLDIVGLLDKSNYSINKLSGGQKQRVAIARALANYPKFLFCDEATSALDPQTTKSILQLIKNIQNSIGLTIVVVTHQMEVAKSICDYVSIIDCGKVVESNTVKNLTSFPQTEAAKWFISTLRPEEERMFKKTAPNSIICRLHFESQLVAEPVLANLIKNCQLKNCSLDVSILSGAIHTVNDEPLGELVLELIGSPDCLDFAVTHLKDQGIIIEVLNV
jgi:D-methionine transport system ATP-binding protein